jgi:hypothetical protein
MPGHWQSLSESTDDPKNKKMFYSMLFFLHQPSRRKLASDATTKAPAP